MTKTTGLLDFLAKSAPTLPEEVVHVEQWDRDVVLRGMTSRERDDFEADNLRRANAKTANGANKRGAVQPDLSNYRARLVSRHIVEDGTRTFIGPEGEKILGDQPAAVLDKLFSASNRLSGFSAEDVEKLSKNSEATPGDEPSSDSLGSRAEQSVN